MKKVKSLKTSAVRITLDGTEYEAGYRHRTHRSKKGKRAGATFRRKTKILKEILLRKHDKRHPPE